MSKKVITFVIILISIALLGIAIIQYIWLKNSVELNSKNFTDKVTFALNRVKAHVEEDANSLETLTQLYNKNRGSRIFQTETNITFRNGITPLDEYRSEILKSQIGNTAWLIDPAVALNYINIKDLDNYLRAELEDQNIDLDYTYGVYSNKDEGFFIANGNYTVTWDNEENYSQGAEIDNLLNTEYDVKLFNTEGAPAAGSLHVFFPKKERFLLSTILPSLLSSILFTGLILFCFIYTINTILRQKKVSIMKTDFINNMTHEFKTPIATISLAVDSINSPMINGSPDKVKRFASIIKEENNRMLAQVEKVLQIAKLDKQDFELKLTDININELTKKAAEHTALKVNQRGGMIHTVLQATNPIIEGDENHISNVIHNLLDNANKYSPEKPNISIETKDTSDAVQIIVKDKGIGMSKDDVKRIFEKFYRVSTGNIHDVKGFGLGLSYVKAIVDAHQGSIDVKSELGKGSIFTITIPKKM